VLALHHVLAGRAVMPAGWHAASVKLNPALASLSTRERQVLELAAAGSSNKEIAARLVISLNTVKFHLRTIYSRLGVHNRVQATQAIAPATVVRTVPPPQLPGVSGALERTPGWEPSHPFAGIKDYPAG
jgi:DNA-binding NarL/FixJ family response regulator